MMSFDNEVEDEATNEEVSEPAIEAVEKSNDEAASPAEAETGGKKAGHWDFLANMLGISSSKKATPEADPAPVAEEVKETASESKDESGMFGLEPIPSPEESSVLSSMFTPSSTPDSNDAETNDSVEAEAEANDSGDDLIGWNPRPRKSFISEAEVPSGTVGSSQSEDAPSEEVEVVYEEGYDDVDVSEGDEVFEFEIEELDPRPRTDEDDAAHGRRRRKPSRSGDRSEGRGSGSRRRGRRDKISSDNSEDVQTDSKSDRSERTDRDESRSEKPRRGRRSRRGSRGGDRQEVAAERRNEPSGETSGERQPRSDSNGGFGAGLEDWDHEIDETPVTSRSEQGSEAEADHSDAESSESRPSGRKRRRRRGGSKSSSERTAEPVAESSNRPKSSGFGAGILDEGDFDLGVGRRFGGGCC